MVRKKKYGIVIFNDEYNHIKFVTDVISQTFGYHPTHALQCTNMIELKGSYLVKHVDNKEVAETYRNILVSNGLIAKIIPL
jgi:ATP-dependent Clp protease adapter protein ClpS